MSVEWDAPQNIMAYVQRAIALTERQTYTKPHPCSTCFLVFRCHTESKFICPEGIKR